jgi:hypothetical protein
MIYNKWLETVKRLEAITRTGLAYSDNSYDRERYEELQQIAFGGA